MMGLYWAALFKEAPPYESLGALWVSSAWRVMVAIQALLDFGGFNPNSR